MAYAAESVWAALPRTTRGTPLVLGGDPKGQNFLYTNGNSVIIRNIDNPAIADVYTEHTTTVNVAKYSPSGFYIASADQHGKVRIWDTVNLTHILKNEFQPIAGPIKDLSWSPDSQRIVIGGEGREKFGHVFMADTGTSVGEISGVSGSINSCDFKPSRPFRIITGSEDHCITIFEGPPFKFKMTKSDHSTFVQAVRFSPDGSQFASAGFDGKVFVYDSKSYEKLSEMGNPAHNGGVYAIAWSPDGKQILSASGDKSCKLWDVSTQQVVSTFSMGDSIEDQQVSCLWQGKHMLAVSLSGYIKYLDANNPSTPIRVVEGHNKAITVIEGVKDKSLLYTASIDGGVMEWDVATGSCQRMKGKGHGNQINAMAVSDDKVYTAGIDDSVKYISRSNKGFTGIETKMDSQPKGIASRDDGTVVVAGLKEVSVLKDGKKVGSVEAPYEANCVSINGEHPDVAVGGVNDHKVHIYMLSGTSLSEKQCLDHLGAVTDVAYSPDNQYLVACDSLRRVILYRLPGYEVANPNEWGFHTAKVNCLAWSPDSLFVASGGLDTAIMIWSVEKPNKHIEIRNAHPMSQITALHWLDNETLVSVGQDANTRTWKITHH